MINLELNNHFKTFKVAYFGSNNSHESIFFPEDTPDSIIHATVREYQSSVGTNDPYTIEVWTDHPNP
ncbi:MAG: hypothetical protein WDA29_10500 [Flavobacteriaceae bacterium]